MDHDLTPGEHLLLQETYGDLTVRAVSVLTGSARAVVSRIAFSDAGGQERSVVVKRFTEAYENAIREAATLRLLRDRRVGGSASLIAESTAEPIILLADLGSHPTLADLLLGTDGAAAEAAVLNWAGTLGRLHADTVDMRDDLERELAVGSAFGAPAVDEMPGVLADSLGQLRQRLPVIDLSLTSAAEAELHEISGLLDVEKPGSAGGITPADTCPDNAVVIPEGLRLLDFEGGQYRHVAWDVAYLTMPWPSCWCAWRLPDEVSSAAVNVWQAAAAQGIPAVMQPAFAGALGAAQTAWALISLGWFLPSALEGDSVMHPNRPAGSSPPRRALLQQRMRTVVETAAPYPALVRLAKAALTVMEREWGRQTLDVSPAFR